jgi:hypothetical protein
LYISGTIGVPMHTRATRRPFRPGSAARSVVAPPAELMLLLGTIGRQCRPVVSVCSAPAHKMLPVNGRRHDLPRDVFGTPRDPSGFLDIYRDPWAFIEIYRDPPGFIEIYGDEVPILWPPVFPGGKVPNKKSEICCSDVPNGHIWVGVFFNFLETGSHTRDP